MEMHGQQNVKKNILRTGTRRTKPTGHMLHRDCLLKHVIGGKIEVILYAEEEVSSYWKVLSKRKGTGI
jgi:hypothetical protein